MTSRIGSSVQAGVLRFLEQQDRQLLRACVVALAMLVMDGERFGGNLAQRREELAPPPETRLPQVQNRPPHVRGLHETSFAPKTS